MSTNCILPRPGGPRKQITVTLNFDEVAYEMFREKVRADLELAMLCLLGQGTPIGEILDAVENAPKYLAEMRAAVAEAEAITGGA